MGLKMSINSLPSRKLAASKLLKINGWNTIRLPFGARLIFRGELLVLGQVYIWKFQLPVANISGNWMICGVFSLRSHDCHDPIYFKEHPWHHHKMEPFNPWVQREIPDIPSTQAKVTSSTGPHRPVNPSICRARIYNRLQELMRAEWGPETGGFCLKDWSTRPPMGPYLDGPPLGK